jgi:hypothetical protein
MVKSIASSALIFSGMTVRCAMVPGPSDDPFLILLIQRHDVMIYDPTIPALFPPTTEELYKIYLERRDLREFKDTSNMVHTKPDDVNNAPPVFLRCIPDHGLLLPQVSRHILGSSR